MAHCYIIKNIQSGKYDPGGSYFRRLSEWPRLYTSLTGLKIHLKKTLKRTQEAVNHHNICVCLEYLNIENFIIIKFDFELLREVKSWTAEIILDVKDIKGLDNGN
jgi:hypothetical protein